MDTNIHDPTTRATKVDAAMQELQNWGLDFSMRRAGAQTPKIPLCDNHGARASVENFSGGPIRIEPVLITKNGRIFES